MRIQMVFDDADRDGGYFAARLRELGGEIVPVEREALPKFADAGTADLVLLLGSHHTAHDPGEAALVKAESQLVRDALASGTPVMGICYGAQLMARALGGTSYAGDEPEMGWRRVDTVDEVLCPEGPGGQLHRDVFAPPPTARVLGSSWFGPQCFVDETFGARTIAWQFHPEVTPETFERWVREDATYYRAAGADPDELIRQAQAHAPSSRNAAHALVDAALKFLEVG